jgi:hypothetical protein
MARPSDMAGAQAMIIVSNDTSRQPGMKVPLVNGGQLTFNPRNLWLGASQPFGVSVEVPKGAPPLILSKLANSSAPGVFFVDDSKYIGTIDTDHPTRFYTYFDPRVIGDASAAISFTYRTSEGPEQTFTIHLSGKGTDNTVYVSATMGDDTHDGTSKAQAVKTVQHALALAKVVKSDAVLLLAGEYPEQLLVDFSIGLAGEGDFINDDNPTPAVIRAPSMMVENPVASGFKNLVVVSGKGVSVDVYNLTLAGPGPDGCASIHAGLNVRDANTNVMYTKFLDIRDQLLKDGNISGCQNGVSVLVGGRIENKDGSPFTTGSATILNSLSKGHQKGGFVAAGAGSLLFIFDSKVPGAGPTPSIAQNGIQFGYGASGLAAGNSLSGYACDVSTCGSDKRWQSCGLLAFDGPADTVSGKSSIIFRDNDVSGSDVGACVSADTLGSSVTLTGNRFIANRYWGVIQGGGKLVLNNNLIIGSQRGLMIYPDNTTERAPEVSGTGNIFSGNQIGVWNGQKGTGTMVNARVKVVQGSIVDNITGAINTTPAVPIDLPYNWWGQNVTDPKSQVSMGVNVTPPLTAPPQ